MMDEDEESEEDAALDTDTPLNFRILIMYSFRIKQCRISIKLAYRSKLGLRLLTLLKQRYPNATLSLVGYADSSGPESRNNELSQQRADAVKDYLVETLGASANQIRCFGAGETSIFHATKHEKNRRTVIALLNK